MIVTMILNGKKITDEIAADMTLFDLCPEAWLLQCKMRL